MALFLGLETAPKGHVKLCGTSNCGGLQLWFWVVVGIELPLQHRSSCILPVITQISGAMCLIEALIPGFGVCSHHPSILYLEGEKYYINDPNQKNFLAFNHWFSQFYFTNIYIIYLHVLAYKSVKRP